MCTRFCFSTNSGSCELRKDSWIEQGLELKSGVVFHMYPQSLNAPSPPQSSELEARRMTDLCVRSKGERRVTVLGALTKCQVQGLWVPVHFPEGSMTRKQGLTTYDNQAHVFC